MRIQPRRLTGFTVLSLLLLVCSAHSVERRVALVIGNSAYSGSLRLPNPVRDAQLMARTLRDLGFEVIPRLDADEKTMKRVIQEFGQRIEQAGRDTVSLFYYAGHAVEFGGVNYLIPINANVQRDRDVELEAVKADWIIDQMEGAGSRVNIVILDACRNNPFKHDRSTIGQGLASMNAPAGSLIAYSTSPRKVAIDGVDPRQTHSPYTAALAHTIQEPGLTAEEMFREVRVRVIAATQGQQTPWENTSLTGKLYFRALPGNTENLPLRVEPRVPVGPALSPHNQTNRPLASATAAELNCGNILIKLSMGLEPLTTEEKNFRQQHCRQ